METKKFYFIVRVLDWHVMHVRDTMDNLEKFLASISSKIVGEKEISYEDAHYMYRKELITETDAIGFDEKLFETLKNEISDRLSKINERAYLFGASEIERVLKNVCSGVQIKTNRINILVSDGEKFEYPENHFVCYRSYTMFSEMPLDIITSYADSIGNIGIILNENEKR